MICMMFGALSVSIGLPKGIGLEASDYYVSMAEKKSADIPEIQTMTTSIGSSSSMLEGDSSTATITITLIGKNERIRTTKEITNQIRDLPVTVPDCEIPVIADDSMMIV